MTTRDYRTEARAVRDAARSRLKELRAARRAAARPTVSEAPSPAEPSPVDVALMGEEDGLSSGDTLAVSPAVMAAVSDEDDAGAEDVVQDDGASEGVDDDLGTEDDPVLADDEPAEADAGSDKEPELEEIVVAGDLDKLPGAGPGLIWLLQQNGINTCADLAGQDADDLRIKLNVTGQLLDIESWIAFSRDLAEQASDPA